MLSPVKTGLSLAKGHIAALLPKPFRKTFSLRQDRLPQLLFAAGTSGHRLVNIQSVCGKFKELNSRFSLKLFFPFDDTLKSVEIENLWRLFGFFTILIPVFCLHSISHSVVLMYKYSGYLS